MNGAIKSLAGALSAGIPELPIANNEVRDASPGSSLSSA
jgi:hypothetical protein